MNDALGYAEVPEMEIRAGEIAVIIAKHDQAAPPLVNWRAVAEDIHRLSYDRRTTNAGEIYSVLAAAARPLDARIDQLEAVVRRAADVLDRYLDRQRFVSLVEMRSASTAADSVLKGVNDVDQR